MSPQSILDAIQQHRSEAEDRMEALKAQIAGLQREAEELAVAERVVRRLSEAGSGTGAAESGAEAGSGGSASGAEDSIGGGAAAGGSQEEGGAEEGASSLEPSAALGDADESGASPGGEPEAPPHAGGGLGFSSGL